MTPKKRAPINMPQKTAIADILTGSRALGMSIWVKNPGSHRLTFRRLRDEALLELVDAAPQVFLRQWPAPAGHPAPAPGVAPASLGVGGVMRPSSAPPRQHPGRQRGRNPRTSLPLGASIPAPAATPHHPPRQESRSARRGS